MHNWVNWWIMKDEQICIDELIYSILLENICSFKNRDSHTVLSQKSSDQSCRKISCKWVSFHPGRKLKYAIHEQTRSSCDYSYSVTNWGSASDQMQICLSYWCLSFLYDFHTLKTKKEMQSWKLYFLFWEWLLTFLLEPSLQNFTWSFVVPWHNFCNKLRFKAKVN